MDDRIPQIRVQLIVAIIVGAFSMISGLLGLAYNGLTMFAAFAGAFEKLPENSTLPYFKPAFFVMSGICIACYLGLIYCAIELFRKKWHVSRLLVLLLIFEVGYFFAIGSLWLEPTVGRSIGAASGVATGGLMIQFIALFPIWAPTALWLSGLLASKDTRGEIQQVRPIVEQCHPFGNDVGGTNEMRKIPDKILARRMLSNRAHGYAISHFYLLHLPRYAVTVLLYSALIGTAVLAELYSVGVFTFGLIVGAFARDLGWFMSIRKSWPFTEKVVDWDKVEELAGGDEPATD